MRDGSDGQHRQGPGAGSGQSGEKSRREPGVVIGQRSGGEQQNDVRRPSVGADISTEELVHGLDEEAGEPSERE